MVMPAHLEPPGTNRIRPSKIAKPTTTGHNFSTTILLDVQKVHTTLVTCNYHQYIYSTCSLCCVYFFFLHGSIIFGAIFTVNKNRSIENKIKFEHLVYIVKLIKIVLAYIRLKFYKYKKKVEIK